MPGPFEVPMPVPDCCLVGSQSCSNTTLMLVIPLIYYYYYNHIFFNVSLRFGCLYLTVKTSKAIEGEEGAGHLVFIS